MKKNIKKLKVGFTTGAAAAAATKGALILIIQGVVSNIVKIKIIGGEYISIPVKSSVMNDVRQTAICKIIKDAGDDPDITHKAVIGAKVKFTEDKKTVVKISGGKGVGIVTKPGLEITPFNHAINPGPIKMITTSVMEVLEKNNLFGLVEVEVFVPKGIELAKKTLNFKLGIINGISILGTTGVVKPMSHDAYQATIKTSLSVARAAQYKTVILTTGRRSERFAQKFLLSFKEDAFLQIGDFFKFSINTASKYGFKTIIIAVFFGKAVKMACGVPHTHAANSELSLKKLSKWTMNITGDSTLAMQILVANTARHAFELFDKRKKIIVQYIGQKVKQSAEKFVKGNSKIEVIIFDFNGSIIFNSDNLFINK